MNKEKILLFILACIQFTNIMDFMIMMPLGPQLMRIFNINPQEFSIIVSSYTISAGIFGFLGAFFIDKFDRKNALLYIYIGFTVGTFACAIAPTYHLLLIARILTGMFGGVLGALVLSIIGDAIPLDRRATAMGFVMAAFSFASVIGVPFGLLLATSFSWHMPFFLLSFLGLIVTLLIYMYIPNMKDHLVKKKAGENPFTFLINIANNGNQVRALLLMVCLMISQFSYISLLSPYLVANVGFTEHDLTYIYLIGGAVTIFTSPLVGKLADKFGRTKVFIVFSTLAIIPLLIITNLGTTPIFLVVIITTFNFVFISGRMIPGSTMITATVLPQNRGGFMSINSSVQQLSSGLAAFLAGIMVHKSSSGLWENYNYVGYMALVASIIAIGLSTTIKAIDNKGKPATEPVIENV